MQGWGNQQAIMMTVNMLMIILAMILSYDAQSVLLKIIVESLTVGH